MTQPKNLLLTGRRSGDWNVDSTKFSRHVCHWAT